MAKAIIDAQFDPSQITLGDLINLYVEKRKIKGLSGLSAPEFRSFMGRPAIEFFESARDESNPLQAFLEKKAKEGVASGSLTSTYSAVKNLEDNVIHQLKRLQRMGEYADDTNGFPRLTDTVIQPKKGAPRSKKLRINPTKYGELKVKLLDWAKNNPKDEPVVRAILTGMYTGFRPKEIINMPMRGTIREQDPGSASKGLFLPADLAKMDEAMSIPLTPHLEGTLNGALNHNKTRFADKQMPDLMFLTDDGKKIPDGRMSAILKQIKVPGILEDARTGEPIDYLTSAYDLRRGHATYVNMLGFAPQVGAEMKARAIKEVGAGEEPKYIAKPFGSFTPQQLSPHIALHNAIDNQAAAYMGIEGANTDKNIILNPERDIIATYKGINRAQDFPTIKTTEIAFTASQALPENISDVTLPKFADDSPIDRQLINSRFKNAFNSINWDEITSPSTTTKRGLAIATGVSSLNLLDPAGYAVEAATRLATGSNPVAMGATAAYETLGPTETGKDLHEQLAEVYPDVDPETIRQIPDWQQQDLLAMHQKKLERAGQQRAAIAGSAPIRPAVAAENKRFEAMRNRAADLRSLQDSLASNKPRYDNGEEIPTTP